jgi:hypothetical protein
MDFVAGLYGGDSIFGDHDGSVMNLFPCSSVDDGDGGDAGSLVGGSGRDEGRMALSRCEGREAGEDDYEHGKLSFHKDSPDR